MAVRDWLERWRSARRARTRSPGYFDARGADLLPAVGTSFCAHEIDAVTGGGSGAFELEVLLVRDPRNLHDRDAVIVQSRDARRLGYLDRPHAAAYAPALDHVGADALVGATAARRARGQHWRLTLHVDRALLEELREAALTGEPPDQKGGPKISAAGRAPTRRSGSPSPGAGARRRS